MELLIGPHDAQKRADVRSRLALTGRTQIDRFLNEASAHALHQVAYSETYNVVSRRTTGHMDMSQQWLDMLTPPQKQGLAQAIQKAATSDFQYLYDNYPIYDAVQDGSAPPVWKTVCDFLNGDTFLALMRDVTGEARIAMADAQLTRFRRGHFLTEHSDAAEGKNRYYAYVLNLGPTNSHTRPLRPPDLHWTITVLSCGRSNASHACGIWLSGAKRVPGIRALFHSSCSRTSTIMASPASSRALASWTVMAETLMGQTPV